MWDEFYSLRRIWARSRCTPTLRARLAFVLISKLPADVREHGNRDRQRARESRESLGAPDRQTVSSLVCRAPVTCARENGVRCVTSLFAAARRRWRGDVMLHEFIDVNRDVIVSRTRDGCAAGRGRLSHLARWSTAPAVPDAAVRDAPVGGDVGTLSTRRHRRGLGASRRGPAPIRFFGVPGRP